MSTQNQKTILWQAPEFKHYPKSYAWYVTFWAISILIVGYFFVNKDFFAGICLLILAGLVTFFAKQEPEIILVEISHKHIRFGNLVFPYQQIQHFWIVNNQHHKTLNIRTTALLNNLIILELENQDPDDVRAYLMKFVPEHPETEPTVPQKIMHKLKF